MGKPKAKKGSRPGKDQKQTSAKTVAYLRVSTIDQDLEKNKADILKLANDKNFNMRDDEGRSSDYKLRFGFSFDTVTICHEKPA